MKEAKPSTSQKQAKGASQAGEDPEDAPVQSDDPKECLRKLTTILAVLVENPAKRENVVRVINGNILQLKKMSVKSDKRQEAALVQKVHESALGLIKRMENLEWKVSAQDKALSEEDHLGTELVTSIVDMKELENLKKDHEKLKQDYDLILQKKGELSKDLVETQEKLEKRRRSSTCSSTRLTAITSRWSSMPRSYPSSKQGTHRTSLKNTSSERTSGGWIPTSRG